MNPTTANTIIIRAIELRSVGKRKSFFSRQYRVKFSIGDTSQETKKAKEKENFCTTWVDNFLLNGNDESVLVIEVYKTYQIGQPKLVGSFNDTIGSMVGKLTADNVLQERLPSLKPDGSSSITIKFVLTVSAPGNTNTDERQADDARIEATAATDALGSTPTAGGVLGFPVDVDSNADKSQAKQAQTETTGAIDEPRSTPAAVCVAHTAVDDDPNAHKHQDKQAVTKETGAINAPRSTSAVVDVNSDGDKSQPIQVVAEATRAIDLLGSTPTAVDLSSLVVDVGSKVVNGAEAFDNTWGILLKRIELFNKIVANIAEVHPYASLAWSVISAASRVLVDQNNRDDRVVRLAAMMSDTMDFVDDAEHLKSIEAHKKTVMLLTQQVTECAFFVNEYAPSQRKNFGARMIKYTFSDIDIRIDGYETKLAELKKSFLEGVTLHTGITVVRMMNVVDHTAKAIDLNDIPYASGARYVQEKGCLPGTCLPLLRNICDILNNPDKDAPRVCLLTGVAGSGKSAVAHTIARLYDGQKRLGSSYFFSSTDVAMRNPQNLFSTIARDLSDHDPQYKSALWDVVKDDRALRMSVSPAEQIERFIIEPCGHLDPIGPLVVVIDALDQCGSRTDRGQLLKAISKQISENTLPTNLRFLITTRLEDDIFSTFASQAILKC